MKLNVEKLKQGNIIKAQNEVQVDNTRTSVKEKVKPIPLNQEQQQNFKLYGSLNRPEVKQTYLSQGRKLTPTEQQASNKKLAGQEKLQNYQKRKEKEAEDLQRAIEVAPYVIPGIGQAMWAGKAVDLATSGASDGKYKSWGNMVDQNVGGSNSEIDKFAADLTNPGYYAGTIGKLATPLIKKGVKSTGRFIDYKLMPERPLTEAEIRLKNIKLNRDGILQEQKTWNMPYKNIIRKGVKPFGYDPSSKLKEIKALIKDYRNPNYLDDAKIISNYNKFLERQQFDPNEYTLNDFKKGLKYYQTEPSMRKIVNYDFNNRFSSEYDYGNSNRHITWDMYLGFPQKQRPMYSVSPLSSTKKLYIQLNQNIKN